MEQISLSKKFDMVQMQENWCTNENGNLLVTKLKCVLFMVHDTRGFLRSSTLLSSPYEPKYLNKQGEKGDKATASNLAASTASYDNV